MKKIFTFCSLCLLYAGISAQTGSGFYSFSDSTITGGFLSMSQFAGKKVMVINCASYCVYTPEYTPLQQLYTDYGQYNFTIVGFPSDDFLDQGGSDSEIIATCHDYLVSFPIMELVNVVSGYGTVNPLFQWLTEKSLNGVSNATIDWNFNKFLVDEQGNWVAHYDAATSPLDTAITNWIHPGGFATGISPVNSDNMIELRSPNPGNSSVDIAVKTSAPQHFNIQMFSIEGKLVGTIYEGTTSNAQVISYPVSNLASGTYLIRVQNATGQQTIRYMVQR